MIHTILACQSSLVRCHESGKRSWEPAELSPSPRSSMPNTLLHSALEPESCRPCSAGDSSWRPMRVSPPHPHPKSWRNLRVEIRPELQSHPGHCSSRPDSLG